MDSIQFLKSSDVAAESAALAFKAFQQRVPDGHCNYRYSSDPSSLPLYQKELVKGLVIGGVKG